MLVGAGDISSCGTNGDEATANVLDGIAGTVFTLGDNVYEDGTAQQFADCYNPSWGRHKARTKPVARQPRLPHRPAHRVLRLLRFQRHAAAAGLHRAVQGLLQLQRGLLACDRAEQRVLHELPGLQHERDGRLAEQRPRGQSTRPAPLLCGTGRS